MILEIILMVAALSATVLICFKKWGWLEYYELYRYSWMPEKCEFCFGFWLAMLMCLALLLFSWNPLYLLIPFCSASITRKLL